MWGRASYRNSMLQSARLVALSLDRQREVADVLGLVQARRSHLRGWWSHRLPVTTVGASGKAGAAQPTGGCNLALSSVWSANDAQAWGMVASPAALLASRS